MVSRQAMLLASDRRPDAHAGGDSDRREAGIRVTSSDVLVTADQGDHRQPLARRYVIGKGGFLVLSNACTCFCGLSHFFPVGSRRRRSW